MSVEWRMARTVRIHCPISQDTFVQLGRGNLDAIERDPAAAKILAVIRAGNPLGDFDLYQGVFEIALGLEGFTSAGRAQPAAGERGPNTLAPTAIITTYVDAAADVAAVSDALDGLVEVHPWENPIIEISDSTVRLPVITDDLSAD